MRRRRFTVPPALAPGSKIAVVAPASSVRRSAVKAGLARIVDWGYEPVCAPGLWRRQGDLAGDPEERLADLHWAMTAPEIAAVWCARGGWGSAQLLAAVDWSKWLAAPRWLIGFSDITALQSAWLGQGVCNWHAPLVGDLADPRRFVARDLRAMLSRPAAVRRFLPGRRGVLAEGQAEGYLAGGCLSVLATLAGTAWQPSFSGAVLLLEEVGETPYRIDRLLWQVHSCGMLRGVRAVLLGQFTACLPQPSRPSRSLRRILEAHFADLGVPVLKGIPAGHGARARAFPLGFSVRVDGDRGEISISPP